METKEEAFRRIQQILKHQGVDYSQLEITEAKLVDNFPIKNFRKKYPYEEELVMDMLETVSTFYFIMDENGELDKIRALFKREEHIYSEFYPMKSTLKQLGIKEIEEYSLDSGKVIKKDIFINERTGYIVPKYEFYSNQSVDNDAYERTLEKYKIAEYKKAEEIPLSIINDLASYRDILQKQIDRQAKQLQEYNQIFSGLFESYFISVEKNNQIFDQSYELEVFLEDKFDPDFDKLSTLFQEIKKIYFELTTDNNLEMIKKRGVLNSIEESPFIPRPLKNYYMTRLLTHTNSRSIYLDKATTLLNKLYPLESILEDFLYNKKIKSTNNYSNSLFPNLQEIPELMTAKKAFLMGAELYYGHDGEYTWDDIFKIMKDKLFNEMKYENNDKLSKELGFKLTSPETFSASARKYYQKYINS